MVATEWLRKRVKEKERKRERGPEIGIFEIRSNETRPLGTLSKYLAMYT